MKKLSEQLSALSDRTKNTEDTVDAVRAKDRAKLEAHRDSLKASATHTAESATQRAADSKTEVGAKWDAARTAVDTRFAAMQDNVETRRASHDAKKAERQAEDAEQDAWYAVDFALTALDQAEYAIIDAALARAEADELQQTI